MRSAFSPLENLSHFTLDNGLRVYLKPDRAAPLVSVQSWVRVGSMDEAPEEAGLSHVLEHMVFKGTRRHKAEEISRWVERLGGSLNAETSREYTHYFIDVPSHGAEQAVGLMGEMLFRASFDPAEWTRECPVVLEEMKRRNDDPEALLWDVFNETLYQEVRLRRPVIGYVRTVENLTMDGLRLFYRKHYTGHRTVLVIAGDFEIAAMRRCVRRAFDAMPASGAARQAIPEAVEKVVAERRLRKDVKQTYLALGFPTPSASHRDQEPLDLLAAYLGEGRSARLVEVLREREQLVWSINSTNITHEGPGVFAVFMESDAKKADRAVERLYGELRRLRRLAPAEADLDRSKNLLQTAWMQSFETYHHQASTIGAFALDHHLDRLPGYLPRIAALTRKDVSRVVDTYLHPVALSQARVEAA